MTYFPGRAGFGRQTVAASQSADSLEFDDREAPDRGNYGKKE
jgi:hypothetical protein